MKKSTWLISLGALVLVIILILPIPTRATVIQTSSGYIYIDESFLDITLVRQDPYPASPGDYVKLLFKIENRGTKPAENVVIELIPSYPFLLDPGTNATKYLGLMDGLQMGENAFLINYKVRVDENAIDGENEINLRYTYKGINYNITKSFKVFISNPRTDFEIIARQSSENILSLSILNIGNNSAQSVVIKLPEQKDLKITGFNSYAVGTLSPGEQKEVSFPATLLAGEKKDLIVEIYYTDKLGIRRVVQKSVPIMPIFAKDFDIIVQEFSANSITLAIANTGVNPAYSVIVGIPQQPNFRVIGSSTTIVGNLGAGDYTLVTFQIQRINLNNTSAPIPRATRNFTQENPVNASTGRNLIVEISYTDEFGIRRTIQKNVELDASTGTITNITQFAQRMYQQQTSASLTYILIGVSGIVLIVGLIVFFKRRATKKK